jgi:hypothetical protein
MHVDDLDMKDIDVCIESAYVKSSADPPPRVVEALTALSLDGEACWKREETPVGFVWE